MKCTRTIPAILILLSLWVLAPAQDTLDLRLHLQPGDQFQFTTSVAETKTNWHEETEIATSSTLTLWITMEVLAVEADGTIDAKMTFDRITLVTESPERKAISEYDSQKAASENEELENPAKLYQALIGQSFQATISPTGNVLNVQGTDTLKTAVMDALPESDDFDQEKGLTTVHGKGITVVISGTTHNSITSVGISPPQGHEPLQIIRPNHLKLLVSLFLPPCPEESVAINDTWTRENENMFYPALTCTSTYTLTAREEENATVQSEGIVQFDSTPKTTKTRDGMIIIGGNMSVELEGTRTGTFKLDEASGTIIGVRLIDSLKGEMEAYTVSLHAGEERSIEKIPTTMTVDTVTTVTGKKLEPSSSDDPEN